MKRWIRKLPLNSNEHFHCEQHIVEGFGIENSIRYFADDLGAQLIAIANHDRSLVRRVIIGSNVEALINHSSLPVIAVNF